MPNLHTIANELLDEISSYLGPLSTASLLITCRSLSFRLQPAMIRHALAPKHGVHPMHWAAENGHLPLVKFLVTRFPVDLPGTAGRTALQASAWSRKNLLVMDFLLLQGADVNRTDDCGLTALHYSCERTMGDAESAEAAVQLLMSHGADIHVEGESPPLVPLTVALYSGFLNVARILLDAGADPNWRDSGDEPFVLTAAREGDQDVLELLLDYGANINASNRHQSNPLLIAAQYGHLGLVKMLVERGARLDCSDNDEDTPLILAVGYRHEEMAEYLVGLEGVDMRSMNRGRNTPLTLAAFLGYDGVIRALLETDCDVNHIDGRGSTALHLAVLQNKAGPVATLLVNGANPEFANSRGETALLIAIKRKNLPIATMLITHGADPNNEGILGTPPLIRACQVKCAEIVSLLLEKGVDINCKDADGVTAMEEAEAQDDPVFVELLVAHARGV